MRRLIAALVVAALIAGCGSSGGSGDPPQLIVSAASSLRNAFADYANQVKDAKMRAGGRADVFAGANTKLPDQLYAEGKVDKPVKFTANKLVLAVPKDSTNVKSLDDLIKPGVKIAIGSASVPIGSYTRKVLAGLPSEQRNRILANVKSEEPDVTGIVGKLTQGAVNAGFVYATDVEAAGGGLKAIDLPAKLEPTVTYGAAVVKDTKHPDEAKAFIGGLTAGAGQQALQTAGFLPLPQ
jgi:molybdate transport system substrate-binding protein